MARLNPKWVRSYRDRHGKQRWYLRKPGIPTMALPGPPGTPAFEDAYREALDGAPPRYHAGRRRDGIIYAIGRGSWVKIGFTRGDAVERVKTLQTSSPEPLEIIATFPGTMDDERALHARFERLRASGEWFRREGDLAEWLSNLAPSPSLSGGVM